MEKYVIGLDFGSLSGRALLVRLSDGAEMGSCVMDYPHGILDEVLPETGERLPPDFALQHPQDYLDVLKTVVPGVLQKTGVPGEAVVGLGLDFTNCTVLPISADLTPLCLTERFRGEKHAYVKLWKHHAAGAYAVRITQIARERGEHFLPYYGGSVSAEWLFPKIWETLECAPEVYAAADGFAEAGDWLAGLLTGKRFVSYPCAAAKAFYLYGEGYPSEDFFAALHPGLRHVVRDKLNAPMVFPTQSCGTLCPEMAESLGLPQTVTVACPLPDAHGATAALRMNRPGDLCAIFGTSNCYLLLGDGFRPVPGLCTILRDTMTPGFWGYESGLCCAGDLLAWASERIAPGDYRDAAEREGISVLQYMIRLASEKKPGETGLLALDWWNGNRSILDDGDLTGLLVGMTLTTKAEDILRALIEANAFATRLIFEHCRANGVEIGRLIAAGGVARKDPFTMQLYADVLRLEIRVAGSAQAPALASAIHGAAAAGEDFDLCMEKMGKLSDTVYRPNEEASAVYDRLYAEYVTLHDYFGRGGNDVMKRLKALRREANG